MRPRFRRLVFDGRGSSTLYGRDHEDMPWRMIDVEVDQSARRMWKEANFVRNYGGALSGKVPRERLA